MRGAAWDELGAEVLGRDSAMSESMPKLVRCLLVEASGGIEGVAHSGNSGAQATGLSSPKGAYASDGLPVTLVTPAPCFKAGSFTG
jgi:hypothetical protein